MPDSIVSSSPLSFSFSNSRPPGDPCGGGFASEFFAPLRLALAGAVHSRVCPELSDAQWLELGVRRALEERATGRGFLQHLVASGVDAPECSHFFETLKSPRRLKLVG